MNLNVPDISFQPLFIYIKSLGKKTLTTAHTVIEYHAAQLNIMIWQCYCLGTPSLIEVWRKKVKYDITVKIIKNVFTKKK